jgi:hypothetical protein
MKDSGKLRERKRRGEGIIDDKEERIKQKKEEINMLICRAEPYIVLHRRGISSRVLLIKSET